ncbi:MAG: nitroreductase family protein [Deltaproteobacteria bacterium]|jgi:SagB-type dehydrogenase family enzyme|nr:nitroreductase family protein [Deltaproteobacteria bacterium]
MAFIHNLGVFLAVWACFGLSASMAVADIKLPSPQTEGGMGLFEALKKRSSIAGGDFSLAELTEAELSTILWAAMGLNRGEKGWTVPMARGLAPYCKIFVAGTKGVWRYDWATHSLIDVSTDNIKGQVGEQAFVRRASYILIVVSDHKGLEAFKSQTDKDALTNVLTGSITQNVYLAAAALSLGARYIQSMDVEAIKEALKLAEGEKPICLMLLGK